MASHVRYPHRATKALEDLDPLNGPKMHDQIYNDILLSGATFSRARPEEHQAGTELLSTLMKIHKAYCEEAGPFGDPFGEYLECNNETSERNGQFFTPVDVVDMMVQMNFAGQDLGGRPKTICDPAAGTGRFMLRIARHFMKENHGALNFIITNIDVDRRAYIYCVMNAILNGIPSICIHGDTLRVEAYDAIATIPIGQIALWERVQPEVAKNLIIQSLQPPVRPAPPVSKEKTVQARLFQDGEDHPTIRPMLDEIQQISRDHSVTLTHVATPGHPDGTISVWWTDAGGSTQRHARALLPDIQEGPRKSPTNTRGRAGTRPCRTHRR